MEKFHSIYSGEYLLHSPINPLMTPQINVEIPTICPGLDFSLSASTGNSTVEERSTTFNSVVHLKAAVKLQIC